MVLMTNAVNIQETQYAESNVPNNYMPILNLSSFSRINSSKMITNTAKGIIIK